MSTEEVRSMISGVVIPAPSDVVVFVEALRTRYNGVAIHHLPPHITLMVPFVSPGKVGGAVNTGLMQSAVDTLHEVCRDVAPFEVTLDRYETFPGGVLYLAPRQPDPIIDLQQRMMDAFPQYPPYGGQFTTFVPHLTVEVFGSEEALAVIDLPPLPKFTFTVTDIQLVYGNTEVENTWTPFASIPLGV